MNAGPAAEHGPILIGFSGGGDSRALLQRAVDSAGDREVIAAVVDHGIREGSAKDAGRAMAMAQEAGARGELRTLEWPQGQKVSQAAARAGRLMALFNAAETVKARDIWLAHTMDDQAETVAMRASRGSGWRGLAGMAADAPAPLWPAGRKLRLRRPMLSVRRADLRGALRARAIEWIEDPANDNTDFARVRIRRRLADWEAQGAGVVRWANLAARIAPIAAGVDRAARGLIAEAARFAEGMITLSPAVYRMGAPDVRAPVLSALIDAAAGAGGGADWDQLLRLDGAILAGEAKAGTLGGARYFARGEDIVFTRDPGAVTGRAGVTTMAAMALALGHTQVWDGRVALTPKEAGWEAVPGADGAAPLLLRARTGGRLTLAQALNQGVIQADWLLEERIAHLLWR